jgi:hypothetical protein
MKLYESFMFDWEIKELVLPTINELAPKDQENLDEDIVL